MHMSKSELIKKANNFFNLISLAKSSKLLKFITTEFQSKNDHAKHFLRISANTHGFKQSFYESLLTIFDKYSIDYLKPNHKEISLLIFSDVTTIYFHKLLKIYGLSIGLDIKISIIEDDKIGYRDDLILNHKNEYDVVLLLLSDNWLSTYLDNHSFLSNDNLSHIQNTINNLIKNINENLSKKIICAGFTTKFFNFNETAKYGNFLSPSQFVGALNNFIENKQGDSFIYLNLASVVFNVGGFDNYFSRMFTLANYPFEENLSIYFSRQVVSLISDLFKQTHRMLVTDLDNTLWGGEVADLGFENVTYGEDTPTGREFKRLQKLIRSLSALGINISAISKNEPNIEDQFKSSKRFVLNYSFFSSAMINLESKSHNITNLEKDIGFNSDFYVYLDDSIFELVNIFVDHPYIDFIIAKNPSYSLHQLQGLCFFKKTIVLDDDITRIENIKKLITQNNLRKTFKTNSEFLDNIDIELIIQKIDQKNFSRIKQLLLKSNQFNLTNKRYYDLTLDNYTSYPVDFLCVEYIDAFGSQGIISVLCLIENNDNIILDNFVMSCRVIGRSVENMIIKHIALKTKKNILGNYIKTDKNKLVENLYHSLGFKYNKIEGYWYINIEEAKKIKTHVKKVI